MIYIRIEEKLEERKRRNQIYQSAYLTEKKKETLNKWGYL